MKKIYLLTLMISGASMSFAQQMGVNPENIRVTTQTIPTGVNAAQSIDDTLGLENFSSQVQFLSDIGGGGYFFGTLVSNTTVQGFPTVIEHQAVGRGFITNDPVNVSGAMIWFAGKEAVNPSPADLTVSVHDLAQDVSFSSSSSQAADGPGPGNELGSTSLAFADINTPTQALVPTYAFFSSPVAVSGDLAIVVDIASLYDGQVDTVIVLNEADGSGVADGTYSWVLQNAEVTTPQGVQEIPLWISVAALIEFESDLAIFAILDNTTVGIEEQGFLNGVKMTAYPNPVHTSDIVSIQYGLENAAEKVDVNIFDMNGKLVHSVVEGDRAAGIHTLTVPAGTLSAGSYIYSLEANGGRIAKRLEILK